MPYNSRKEVVSDQLQPLEAPEVVEKLYEGALRLQRQRLSVLSKNTLVFCVSICTNSNPWELVAKHPISWYNEQASEATFGELLPPKQ